MRYNKGSKVEVFSQNGVLSGVWRGAEIICGNGHNYTVKYDACLGTSDEVMLGRVSRKVIRPSPPFIDVSENWVSGDIVEVYDDFCWKIASISKLLGRSCFLVRLVGSLQEFTVNKVYLRARLFCHNDEWIAIGKVSRNFEDVEKKEKYTLRDDSFAQGKNIYAEKIEERLPGTLKRRLPHLDSPVETYVGSSKKYRLIEKEGRCDQIVAAKKASLPEKVLIIILVTLNLYVGGMMKIFSGPRKHIWQRKFIDWSCRPTVAPWKHYMHQDP